MRLLILSVSALSLGACSVGGVGFGGFGQGGYGYDTQAPAQHGVWTRSAAANNYATGHTSGFGPGYTSGHANVPCGFDPCAAPAPVMPYAPVATNPYPSGYMMPPVVPPVVQPAPQYHSAPAPAPVMGGCQLDPCSGGYSVSPYAHGVPAGHGYGAPQSAYGAKPGYLYGTLGAVYYDTDNPSAGLQGRLGYQTASWFGGEVEGSFGVLEGSEDFTTVNGVNVAGEITDKVDYSVAAFGTVRAPLGPNVSALARLGYHNTSTSRDYEFANGSVYESSDVRAGLAYGAGLQYDFSPTDGVRLDVTRYEGGDDLDTLSLAYLRRF